MRVEKGKVRAPEIGRVWLNSPPLSFHQLRGRVVLVDFWDYTCVNCIRTLPYVQAWHERYHELGLTVIGVHTPEFTFAQYESNVERGIREFGLTYPIVIDSNREIWKLFANRCWPSKYLLDKEGYLRFGHFGEGAYGECEEAIQELLREIDPAMSLPSVMEPLRGEDSAGALCYPATPELYLGHARGRIGNADAFHEDQIAEYSLPSNLNANSMDENCFYASGSWASTVEYLEAAGAGEHRILLKYSAAAVNLVMASPRGPGCDVIIRQDGKALSPQQGTVDVRFRDVSGRQESYLLVQQPRMYFLVDNREFGEHTLELICPEGLAAFAFTFTSCVDPSRSAVLAGSSSQS
jgi:thiol-disulfide isomerase/thioredoxin